MKYEILFLEYFLGKKFNDKNNGIIHNYNSVKK